MTGGGVHQEQDYEGSDSEEFCRFYIGADGPDANSSEEAKNLWGLFCLSTSFVPLTLLILRSNQE
jgi:hypothetical protein